MLEYYYSIFIFLLSATIFVYSRSIPVVLVSLYISSWFFPQGLNVFGFGLMSILFGGEILYMIVMQRWKKNKVSNILSRHALFFACYLIVFYIAVSLLGYEMPIVPQIAGLKYQIYYLFNIIFIVYSLNNPQEFKAIVKVVLLLIVISGIYSGFTYVTKENPFALAVLSMTDIFDESGLANTYLEEERGFLTGRISGLTVHPLMFGGVLSLCVFLLLFAINQSKSLYEKGIFIFVLLFSLLLIVFTGSRSILIGTMTGLLFYLFLQYKKKVLLYGFIAIIGIYFIGFTIEDDFLRSTIFFWEDNSEIKGSSSDMRSSQIEAGIERISGNISSFLFGLGNGWVGQYSKKYGNVPPFHGFESIILTSILQFGILGTITYFYLIFVKLYKVVVRHVCNPNAKDLLLSFLLAGFVVFSFTGGVYGLDLYVVLTFLMVKWHAISMLAYQKESL